MPESVLRLASVYFFGLFRPGFNIFQRYSKTQTARLNNAGSPKRLDQDVEWMVTAAWRVADGILEPRKRVLHLLRDAPRVSSVT